MDRLDGKVGPLQKLRGEQPAHEGCVGVYLIEMHFASGHEHLLRFRQVDGCSKGTAQTFDMSGKRRLAGVCPLDEMVTPRFTQQM